MKAHYSEKYARECRNSLRAIAVANASLGMRGNALLLVMLVVFISSASGVIVNQMLTNDQQGAAINMAQTENMRGVNSSLAVIQKLFTSQGGQPAIYLEPYLGNGAKRLVAAGMSGAANWSISNGLVSIRSLNGRVLTPNNMAQIYTAGQFPALGSKDVSTAIRLASIDSPVPSAPYLIPSIVVNTTSTTPVYTKNSAPITKINTARIALAAPPTPTCTITASPNGTINQGTTVTFTVSGTGVVAGGSMTLPYGSVVGFNPGANGAPTAAASVLSSNLTLATTSLAMNTPTPFNSGSYYYATATVIGADNTSYACTSPPINVLEPDTSYNCAYKCVQTSIVYACDNIMAHAGGGCVGCFGTDPNRIFICYKCNNFYGFDSQNNCNMSIVGGRTAGCFDPETLITMADGVDRPIKSLREGNWVFNPISGKPAQIRKVIAGPEPVAMLAIGYAGHEVKVTNKHAFIGRRGIMAASELRVGDEIQVADNTWQRVEVKDVLPIDPAQQVWNLMINSESSDSRDHAVSAGGITTGDLYLQERLSKVTSQ